MHCAAIRWAGWRAAGARGWCTAAFTPRCFPMRRWNAEKDLHGESLTVAGKEYTLWFAIPGGYEKASAQVSGKDGKTIAAEWKQQGQFASMRFTGTSEPAEWRVQF